jgi:hypothetical protein
MVRVTNDWVKAWAGKVVGLKEKKLRLEMKNK